MIAGASGCRGSASPEAPRVPPIAAEAVDVTHDGLALRGVAGDAQARYAAFSSSTAQITRGLVEARRSGTVLWSTPLPGRSAGELAVSDGLVAVGLVVPGESATRGITSDVPAAQIATDATVTRPLRGDPAAILAAFDARTGAPRWERPLESTQWASIAAIAADESGGFVVAGSFGGTLRVGAQVVSSAGGSDGFVARVDARGELVWLVRMGGQGSDAIQSVAVRAGKTPAESRVALAGTFSLAAELRGEPLESVDERSPFGDIVVAELDGTGARRWSKSFGSRGDDVVSGVAIDRAGRVIVAAVAQDVMSIAGTLVTPRGAGDGLLVWFSDDGELGNHVLVGGNDFDGIRALTAVGDHVVIAGFFSKTVPLGDQELNAFGSDDAYLATLDADGVVLTATHVRGQGREEITSLAALPGGVIAGVAHTADVSIDSTTLPAPSDPMTGAAVLVRGE